MTHQLAHHPDPESVVNCEFSDLDTYQHQSTHTHILDMNRNLLEQSGEKEDEREGGIKQKSDREKPTVL